MSPAPYPRMHGVSHVPGGPDPIPGLAKLPGGATIDAVIEGFAPAGWWKLNEDSGTVAADSSGNGLDMTADTGPPIWGEPAGPPGEQTADFETGTSSYPPPAGTLARVARSWAAMTADFTAGIWLKRNATTYSMVMGQGNPARGGGTGWAFEITAATGNRVIFSMVNTGTSVANIEALNPLPADEWVFVAGTFDAAADTARLYLNGLEQGTDTSAAFAAATNPLWIGHDAGLGGNAYLGCTCTLSYAFVIPSVLTGTELLSIYESATIGGAGAGKVLTATGLGATTWDYPYGADPAGAAEGDVLTIVSGVPTWQAP